MGGEKSQLWHQAVTEPLWRWASRELQGKTVQDRGLGAGDVQGVLVLIRGAENEERKC